MPNVHGGKLVFSLADLWPLSEDERGRRFQQMFDAARAHRDVVTAIHHIEPVRWRRVVRRWQAKHKDTL